MSQRWRGWMESWIFFQVWAVQLHSRNFMKSIDKLFARGNFLSCSLISLQSFYSRLSLTEHGLWLWEIFPVPLLQKNRLESSRMSHTVFFYILSLNDVGWCFKERNVIRQVMEVQWRIRNMSLHGTNDCDIMSKHKWIHVVVGQLRLKRIS